MRIQVKPAISKHDPGQANQSSGTHSGEWRLHKPEPLQPGAFSAQVALGVIAEPATRRV